MGGKLGGLLMGWARPRVAPRVALSREYERQGGERKNRIIFQKHPLRARHFPYAILFGLQNKSGKAGSVLYASILGFGEIGSVVSGDKIMVPGLT